MDLTNEEIRVLGCLIEKALTTPDQYPLTLNALVLACNQSTSRDPVVSYGNDEVKSALDHLRMRHRHVRVELPGHGSRVEKYKHDLVNQLHLTIPEQAVLAVLALRGPQTINELKTRTERLYGFASTDEIEKTIDQLCDPTIDVEQPATTSNGQLAGTQPTSGSEVERPAEYRRPWNGPLAQRLERLPGHKEPRVGQLLGGPIDVTAITEGRERLSVLGAKGERLDSLELELAGLKETLAALRSEFDQFRSQF